MPEKEKVVNISELIKQPEPTIPNAGNGSGKEIHRIELGKFSDLVWARIRWIDAEIAKLQEQLAMHQSHRNLLVEKSAAEWGILLEPSRKYEIATNQSLVEIREVILDGTSKSDAANRPD